MEQAMTMIWLYLGIVTLLQHLRGLTGGTDAAEPPIEGENGILIH